MKAAILAAGYATRLYPLTLDKPKPLLNVNSKPIASYILERLIPLNLDKTYVVTNNKFFQLFKEWAFKQRIPVEVVNDGTNSNEDSLGAIGDIHFLIQNKNIEDDLLIIAGDNLFDFDISKFVDFFKQKKATCIGMIDHKDKSKIAGKYGCVLIDKNNRIIDFEEKPQKPKSTMSATMIYALKAEDLMELENCLNHGKTFDNGGEFIRYLSERKPVYGYLFNEKWFDIGSMEQLKAAEDYFTKK